MGGAERVEMNVHVALRDRDEEAAVFLGSSCGKTEDEARRAVVGTSRLLVANCAFAHRIGVLEQLAPAPFVRAHEFTGALDEGRSARFGEGRALLSHEAIVTCRHRAAQLCCESARALDVFGPSRLLYGGDWPFALLAADDYAQIWQGITGCLSDLSAAARTAILHDNAVATYGLADEP